MGGGHKRFLSVFQVVRRDNCHIWYHKQFVPILVFINARTAISIMSWSELQQMFTIFTFSLLVEFNNSKITQNQVS